MTADTASRGLASLPLRLRVFLFFALMAIGTVAVIAGSLIFAAGRADGTAPVDAMVTAGVIAGFLSLGLILGIWWLFDENVAQPIDRISTELRTRAHAEVDRGLDTATGRYLGDLAPAADAVAHNLARMRGEVEEEVAERTEDLRTESERLSALLSDIQTGLLVCSPSHRLVFYNAPAVDLLRDTGKPRLDRSVFDLLREGPIRRTYERLRGAEAGVQDAEVLVSTAGCGRAIAAHLRLVRGALGIGEEPGYVLTLRDISADMRLHLERERLLAEAVEGLRPRAAGLRALLDWADDGGGSDARIEAALKDEAAGVAEAIHDIGQRHDALQDTWWPMQDVDAAHLIDALRGQLAADGPQIAALSADMILRCDGYALANMLAALIETAARDGLGEVFSVAVEPDGGGAQIVLSWTGRVMPMADLGAILDDPVRDGPLGVTGREILDHHNTDIWPEAGPEGLARLVLPIVEARQAAPEEQAPGDGIAERPAVFDFALLNRARGDSFAGRSLRELTFVVFDTETTGLEPQGGDEIVQIAAVRIVNGRRVAGEVFDELVNPGRLIPPRATEVHHITDAMVADAPPIDEVGAAFHRFCADAVLVAHNAPFDMAFLHRHAARIGAQFDHPVFDTVLLSAILFGQTESHTLDALADRFGVVIPEEDRHTAIGDTVATAEVFQRMLPMLAARGLEGFDATMEAMSRNSRLLREMKARVG